MDQAASAATSGGPRLRPKVEPASRPASREVEIKFKTDAAGLKRALASPLLSTGAANTPSRTLRSTYFDTAMGDLRKNGIVLRVRKDRRVHIMGVKWATAATEGLFCRGEVEVRVPGFDPDLAFFDEDIAVELGRITEGRRLERQFETQVRRRVRSFEFGQSVIEAAFDQGLIIAGDRRQPFTELELELKAGDAAALYEMAVHLADALPLQLHMMSKAERGFKVMDGSTLSSIRAETPHFPAEATLDDAVETVIAATLRQFVANWPALEESRHPESIHQMRVSLRRLRTALAFFNRALPCAEFEAFGAEAKRLADTLGPAREWDAFIQMVETGPLTSLTRDESFVALATAVEERRQAAYMVALELIHDQKTTQFVLNLQAFMARHTWRSALSGEELSRLTRPASDFASETLERLHKRALKRGSGIRRLPPAERHKVRIALKNIRYAAEFFSGFFSAKSTMRPYIRTVSHLQNELGAHNDAAGAAKLLRDVEATAGPRAARASGVVLGWYGRESLIAEDHLSKAWKSFKQARKFWR
jgi:triphosphatase